MLFLALYLSLLGLVLLGISILVALRMVYGRSAREDIVERSLSLTGLLAIFAGIAGMVITTLGMASILFIIIALLVAQMIWVYFQRSEHQVLMHLLAKSARQGISLDEAADAYSRERNTGLGWKAELLAGHLRGGRTLVDALQAARIHNAPDLQVATRVGGELGILAPLLHDATQALQDPAAELRRSLHKLFYIALLLGMIVSILTFVMNYIVPTLSRMFQFFSVTMPALTELSIVVSDAVLQYWFFSTPLLAFMVIVLFCATIGFLGLLPTNFPLANRFSRRYDEAQIMLVLARATEAGVSVGETLDSLARHHPRTVVRARLALALEGVRAGTDWTEALRFAGIISRSDAELLRASQQADNVAWALRQTATRGIRRFDYRLRCLLAIGFPLLLLLIAVVVGMIVIALFMPLPALINGILT